MEETMFGHLSLTASSSASDREPEQAPSPILDSALSSLHMDDRQVKGSYVE